MNIMYINKLFKSTMELKLKKEKKEVVSLESTNQRS